MIRSAATPIADAIHDRLLELDSGLDGETSEEVALAIIAGAGRFLYERSSATRHELEQRIVKVIAGDRHAAPPKAH